ncbi:MAG TPA: site-specific integrase [Frankiaceae bacterium]|jgi:site-specific recombinase XerC|nr:site-specific integrase [Frankiaceae bacterium]
MDAEVLGAEIGSFQLHLAAEGRAPKTIRLYTEAVAWFAAARLLGEGGKTCWEQADRRDVQEWMTWLLDMYSDAYASNQYRALQQFFKWLSAEEDLPDPMDGLHSPKVAVKLGPVFSGTELARLEHACAGREFAQRRDAAIITVLKASGIRLRNLSTCLGQRLSGAVGHCGGHDRDVIGERRHGGPVARGGGEVVERQAVDCGSRGWRRRDGCGGILRALLRSGSDAR